MVIIINIVMSNNFARRVREKSEMRLKIMDAARELFLSGGEEAVTLRRIADKIEYSATTIYLHFPNKEALIDELCATDFGVYSRVLQQAERITDPLLRLRKIAMACVDFGLLYPAHYRAMFMTVGNAKPVNDPLASNRPGPAEANSMPPLPSLPSDPYEFLHRAVFKAMAAGCFQPQYRDVALIAQVIWSGLHGAISLHLVRSRHTTVSWRPVQASAEMIIDCLLDGLTLERVASP